MKSSRRLLALRAPRVASVLLVAAPLLGAVMTACGTAQSLSPDAGATAVPDAPAASPSACPNGSVSFTMLPPKHDPSAYCAQMSFGDPGDGVWWYSVATAAGAPLQLFLKTATSCGPCDPKPIPVGSACQFLSPDASVGAAWDGTEITGGSTCNGGASTGAIGCDVTSCAPAGDYVVTMCAEAPEADAGPEAGCVSVPFHYPTSDPVVGQPSG